MKILPESIGVFMDEKTVKEKNIHQKNRIGQGYHQILNKRTAQITLQERLHGSMPLEVQ